MVRKAIKNLHLGVYPPNGRVRVAAPLRVSNDAVRLAVIEKLGWINRQRSKFARQPRQSKREMLSGESHYFLGRRYRLRVLEAEGRSRPVVTAQRARIDLVVVSGTSRGRRLQFLDDWYRSSLREIAGPLVEKWAAELGVEVAAWGIKKMKTKWGACNAGARRVWLNLELAKVPLDCIEYVVAHEVVHLLVQRHDERFQALLDRHLPAWRGRRDRLQAMPLPFVEWR